LLPDTLNASDHYSIDAPQSHRSARKPSLAFRDGQVSSSLEKLKKAETIDDLAAILGYKPSALA
jgi:hypothetical protein